MAFPTTALNLTVELALGADLTADPSTWAWTDVTAYVYARDFIRIQRGRPDGATQTPPSLCQFTADNGDGRWCAYDPSGAWFGQIGRGTPVRILVDEGTSSVRWTGFLSALPPRWSPAQTDRYVQVSASGILQRLERGSTPLRSALVRAIAGGSVDGSGTHRQPVAYWPGEDGSGATSLAEYSGGPAMTFVNSLTPASDGPDGSLPLPEFTSSAGVSGSVPAHPLTGKWEVACLFNFPAVPSAAVTLMRWKTSGTYPTWEIILTPGTPDVLTLVARDTADAIQINEAMNFDIPSGPGSEPYGHWLLLFAAAEQVGANVDYDLQLYAATAGAGVSGTENSITTGVVTRLSVPASAKLDGMHAGHWAVWDTVFGVFPVDPAAISAFSGDTVSERIARINIVTPVPVDGAVEEYGTDDVNKMGPQIQGTRLDAIRECETVTNGRLIENRDPTTADAVLGLLAHDYLTNQTTDLTLNHDSGNLAPPFEPTDDDQNLRNDWTATRSGATGTGSSARVVATEGEHGSLTPDNVGTYADSVSVNVELDSDLIHQAGWRVNLGTVEGLRFPVVTLDFAHDPSLIPSWIGCDIGSRITITNPPAGIAPDSIDLLIEGWTEVFGPKTWTVQLNCSPYRPWHVFRLAETSSDTNAFLGRLAGDEHAALRASLTSSATGATNFDPNFYKWTEVADDFPMNIRMGGEVITLSGISSSAASFVAAGAASHADNAAVTPALYAGGAIRQLILVFAAIRSSGTGTLATPTGYTRLPVFNSTDHVQLFAKVHTGTESDPTITPSGGAAGDTVSAFTFGLSATPSTLGTATGSSLSDIVLDSIVQLNASAANIGYGGLYAWQWTGNVNLLLAWKQDDYTSIAVPSGWTEILEASSTTGNDQGLYAAYRIDTTPVLTPEGSLVVTGGASAISRSAVVALAGGIQVMTISARSVNGVTKAHSAGAIIAVEDPAVLAL
ncbi:MAG TPA: hypothetical protein VF174_08790 [Micromonosporaceae bacterium]